MRVLIVQFWPRFETALELAQNHLDAGDEVVILGCGGEMAACWLNPYHTASVCAKCVHTRERGLALLEPRLRARSFLKLTDADRDELRNLKTAFADLDALKGYRVEAFDLGMAVASGLMTTFRDPYLDVSRHADTIARLVVSCAAVYRSLQNHLDDEGADCAYVANGRGCEARAVLRACQSRGVRCLVHEIGRDKDHYQLYENVIPHDLSANEARVRAAWEAASSPQREEMAARWFEDRAGHVDQYEASQVKRQQKGLLPEGFDPSRRNMVIFNSSEDEFAALDDQWKNPLYRDQLDGLCQIRRDLGAGEDAPTVYLRIHPYLKGADNSTTRALHALAGPRFHVIPAEDPVSTYTLMRSCRTVLAFGSTTGIEAVYWGKPSVCAGMCVYRNLGGTYNPQSHAELLHLLRTPLQPRERLGALMYGHYLATFGFPYKHYRRFRYPSTHFDVDGTFKGRRIEEGRLIHYVWAAVHRLPPLSRYLDSRNRVGSLARLGLSGSCCP